MFLYSPEYIIRSNITGLFIHQTLSIFYFLCVLGYSSVSLLTLKAADSGATSPFLREGGAKFDFEGFGWRLQGASPPSKNVFEKSCFSGFVVKKHKFLVVEGLALCLIIYQIPIISKDGLFLQCLKNILPTGLK